MNQTITITSKSVADQLNKMEVRNFNPMFPMSVGARREILNEDSSRLTMFASEAVLRREWDTPEEDEAWAHL
jgi:hypothetical protein